MDAERRTAKRSDAARPVRAADPALLVRPLCHEVGNLLAALRLTGHLLGDETDRRARRRSAHEIERLTAHAGALLAQMRPLLAERANGRVHIVTGSLLASVARAAEELVPPGVTLRVARGRGLPDLHVDSEALHHVLLALLLEAMEDSVPRGRVTLRARADRRHVVLVLEDAAPTLESAGLRPEQMRGRQLALTVAATLLRPGRGRVRVANRGRRGNRVELWLPCSAPGRPAAAGRRRRSAR